MDVKGYITFSTYTEELKVWLLCKVSVSVHRSSSYMTSVPLIYRAQSKRFLSFQSVINKIIFVESFTRRVHIHNLIIKKIEEYLLPITDFKKPNKLT